MMLELKLILLCLPSILLATTLDSDNKSILANTDWKKLWLESGQLSSSGRIDNHLDSSDSTLIDDGEVMAHNTTVQLGGVAFLVCKVAGVDRNQISWIRRRDWHILSSGAQMYTNDERFAILHTPGSNTWTLQIKFVQRRDHGTYECQYVYWQRNDRMINYDDSRRDITIETTPGPRTQSRLIIREPQINDSGNYTCSASNTEPASIYVFVSKG
uniref:Ig-like domain-containing protein n=1 Tax=Anopheles merus TaxID=30066 RepID=A0A9I3MII9_ANOME